MRSLAPRSVLLALTILAIIGSVLLIQLKFGPVNTGDAQTQVIQPTTGKTIEEPAATQPTKPKDEPKPTPDKLEKQERPEKKRAQVKAKPETAADRIAKNEKEFKRAAEITGSTGYINTEGLSLEGLRGEKVVLLEFWTYTCYNCQNANRTSAVSTRSTLPTACRSLASTRRSSDSRRTTTT